MLDWISGKKIRVGLSLSQESVEALDAIASQIDCSRSDVIDRLLQTAQIPPSADPSSEPVTDQSIDQSDPQFAPEDRVVEVTSELSGDTTTVPISKGEVADVGLPPEPVPTRAVVSTSLPEEATTPAAGSSSDLEEAQAEVSNLQGHIRSLEYQVSTLQTQLTEQSQQLATLRSSQRQQQEQVGQYETQIQALEQELTHFRQMAAIGEAKLNRWRFQNFAR